MNTQKNKPSVSTARAMPYPEDIGVYSKTTDPYQDLWWLLVILLNIPVFIAGTGRLVLLFDDFAALIVFIPWVVTPVWNIQNILARWRAPLAKVKWWKLAVTCNLYIGLFGILIMVNNPGKVLPVPMIFASLTGINLAWPRAEKNKEISGALKLLIFTVIALNTMLLLFMLALLLRSTINNFSSGEMIFTAPLLIIAALNVFTALKIGENIQTRISWRRWIVFGNILVGLFGLMCLTFGQLKLDTYLISTYFIATALAGTTLIILSSRDRLPEKD